MTKKSLKKTNTRKNKINKSRTMKRGAKKGGLFNRVGSMYNQTSVQTYCCDSKTSLNNGLNEGQKCSKSRSGQCYPGYSGKSYKFRCYNNGNEDLKNVGELSNRKQQCKYVSGVLGKVGNSTVNLAGVTGSVVKAVATTATM
jgi:hypothetical protein